MSMDNCLWKPTPERAAATQVEVFRQGINQRFNVQREDFRALHEWSVNHSCMPIGFFGDEDGSRYHAACFDKFDKLWCHGDYVAETPSVRKIVHGERVDNVETLANPEALVLFENLTELHS